MADALTRATLEIPEESLDLMVLTRDQLPSKYREFAVAREGVLDNGTMARYGFPGQTEDRIRAAGRLTGCVREFVLPEHGGNVLSGTDVMVATAIHLFEDRDAVLTWMREMFVRQFQENIGKTIGPRQTLKAVEELGVDGFHDTAVLIKAVQEGAQGVLSSTVIDFRVGRLLGVAFATTGGNVSRRALVERLGSLLEKQIVRVVLGAV
ncbi:hypothetical protein M1O29_04425 [Dehalococcoidia bacterium]|nr:hypothetical protein [Dehalococcoidia bacterium]